MFLHKILAQLFTPKPCAAFSTKTLHRFLHLEAGFSFKKLCKIMVQKAVQGFGAKSCAKFVLKTCTGFSCKNQCRVFLKKIAAQSFWCKKLCRVLV